MSREHKLLALCTVLTISTALLSVAAFGNFVGAQDADSATPEPTTTAVPAQPSKVALFDFNKVMLADKTFDQAFRQLADQLRTSEKEFKEGIQKEISEIRNKLRSRTIGSPEWRELNRKLSEAQMQEIDDGTLMQGVNRDDRDAVLMELVQRTDKAVQEVCKDLGYDTVVRKVNLDLTTMTGVQNYIQRAVVMHYQPEGRDITDEVIARLNKE